MKKNAMIVASILFVAAGCAHQGGAGRTGMDTGTGADVSTQPGSYSTEHLDRYPDGTLRTPAAERSANFQSGSDIQADSSVRGGTLRARGVEPYHSSLNSGEAQPETLASSEMPDDQSGIVDSTEYSDRADFDQSGAASWDTDKAGDSVRASANWNASDDLLQDGPLSGEEALIARETPAPVETGSSFESSSDSAVSSGVDALDQENSGIGAAAGSESGSSSSSESSNSDLNSSENLEENISGDIELESGSTNPDGVQPQVGVTSNEPEWLFENNRAQGVGSAATGEFGVATSRDPLAPAHRLEAGSSADQQLEGKVKRRLVMESTGTHGLMRHEVSRNVEVSAKNGIVTLKGSVPSENDREMIEIRASEISGVKKVDNQIVVTPAADPANRDLGQGSDLEDRTDRLQD
jgi:osmotically-inducible protein OsmY